MIYGSNIRSCSVRKCPHLVSCSLEIHWEMPALVLHMLSRFLFFRNPHLKNAWLLLWTVFCEQGTPVGPCALQIWSRCVRKSVQTKPANYTAGQALLTNFQNPEPQLKWFLLKESGPPVLFALLSPHLGFIIPPVPGFGRSHQLKPSSTPGHLLP